MSRRLDNKPVPLHTSRESQFLNVLRESQFRDAMMQEGNEEMGFPSLREQWKEMDMVLFNSPVFGRFVFGV